MNQQKKTCSRRPERVEEKHIGLTILYKLPNQAVISEGEIEKLSPCGEYFRCGPKRWLPNRPGSVLSVLTQKQKPRRRGIRTGRKNRS